MDDATLLRRYVEDRSEAAFKELVQRYIDLVHATAARQLPGEVHAADDITLEVFCLLARKAPELTTHPALAGWLHTTARLITRQTLRAHHRRKVREHEAHRMHDITAPATPADWDILRPTIDDTIGELEAADRDIVLLRFFNGRKFAEIGALFSITEDAARMRLERALERLRAGLKRRGITSTGAALALVLAHPAPGAAPAGLAAQVAAAAFSTGSINAGTTFLALMQTQKMALGVTAIVAVILVGIAWNEIDTRRHLAGTLHNERARFAAEIERLQSRIAGLEIAAPGAPQAPLPGDTVAAVQPPVAGNRGAMSLDRFQRDEDPAKLPRLTLRSNETHAAFIIDTSGSMRDPTTEMLRSHVLQQVWVTLVANPQIEFIQILDADGRFIAGRADGWLPNSESTRDRIEQAILQYKIFSNSNPVPGMVRAIRTLQDTDKAESSMSLVLLADEVTEKEGDVIERLEALNPPDAAGRRRVSINAVTYSTRGIDPESEARFTHLMQRITDEHNGTAVVVP